MNISKFTYHLAVSLFVIGLIIANGCAPAPATVPVSISPSAPIIVPTASPTPTMLPTATLVPTATVTPFVPKATIRIASHSPLTGDQAVAGTDIMRGAELAVRQLADPLMELGYKVELVSYDDQNDVGNAVTNAKDIVADTEILCGVGHYFSRIMLQTEEIYHQAGLAFVAPSTTAAFVTESGYLEINRVVGRSDSQGAAGAQFAKAQGYSRVFIISHGADYGKFNAYHFRNEASRSGVTVVGDMSTDAMENFGWLIDRVLATNADLVYFSGLADQGGAFFREARAAGYQGAFLGPDGLDSPVLLERAGPLLIEGGGSYYTAMAAPASAYPEAAEFLENFETLYGAEPQLYSAQAYDAAGICLQAIEQASEAKGGEIPTRTEVATAIRALQDYNGITGVYNFNKNGDPNPAQYFVFQVVSADPEDWNQNTLISSFEVMPPE
jgi:ABC-type branched-subunit amino acid transport system substrate-binding protein